MAVYPPSYGVQIGDNIRETEAVRLRTRGEEPASYTALQVSNAPHSHVASSSPFALQQVDPNHVSSMDGDFDDFQGPSDGPLYSHQQPVSHFGGTNATGTSQHAKQTFAADWDHYPTMRHPHQMSSYQHDIRNVSPAHPYATSPDHVHGQVHAHNEPAQPRSNHFTEFGAMDDIDDDGFGDFAEAPPSPQRDDPAQQSIPPVSDRHDSVLHCHCV